MTEIVEPGVLNHKPKRKIKVTDVFLFVVITAIIVVLAVALLGKIQLRNEVNGAQAVADKVVADITRQDADAARKLGDQNFQAKNSSDHLKTVFATIQTVAKGNPSVVKQTVDQTTKPDTVYILYKYGTKEPYYIRVGAQKTAGTWHLANLSGNSDQSKLSIKH